MERFNEALKMVRTNMCYMQRLDMDYGIRVQNLKLHFGYTAEFEAQGMQTGNWFPCSLEDLEVRR